VTANTDTSTAARVFLFTCNRNTNITIAVYRPVSNPAPATSAAVETVA
jgi:hypothetical protein